MVVTEAKQSCRVTNEKMNSRLYVDHRFRSRYGIEHPLTRNKLTGVGDKNRIKAVGIRDESRRYAVSNVTMKPEAGESSFSAVYVANEK